MQVSLVAAFALIVGSVLPATAQTAPASPAPPPSSLAAPTPALTPSVPTPSAPAPTSAPVSAAQPNVKEIRATCRSNAKADGAKGEAMRKAVSDCVVKQRPELAGREQCRLDGFAKGLRKDDLHAFVKDCAKTKG